MISTSTDGAALARRLERLRDSFDGLESKTQRGFFAESVKSPQAEAQRVLEHCRRDLGLPYSTRIEWHDDFHDYWGEVLIHQPTIIRLSRRLLTNPRQLVETTAHEARHARRILDGLVVYDDAAERDALAYGRSVAASWR